MNNSIKTFVLLIANFTREVISIWFKNSSFIFGLAKLKLGFYKRAIG